MERQSETFKSTAAILRNAERVFVLTGAGAAGSVGDGPGPNYGGGPGGVGIQLPATGS